MARKLRAVSPEDEAPRRAPATLIEAVGGSRREFLTMARWKIASEIDKGGVPSHALGRLIAEMDRLDGEVRLLDTRDEQEAKQRGPTEDESWSAI